MPSKSKVCFFFETRGFALADRTRLKRFIESIFKKEKKDLSFINFIFCSDKYLLQINKKYLNHDFYTDIVTFGLTSEGSIEAEVYISVDRVRENAKTLGISFKSELERVIFHGALHLCGYKDKTQKEIAEIRRKEDHYLSLY